MVNGKLAIMNALKMELVDLVERLPDDRVADAIDYLRLQNQLSVSDSPEHLSKIRISPVSGFPTISIGRRVTPELVAEMIDE